MASFGPIAPHYDVLMANVPYDMWAGYYRLLLSKHGADPDTLLDVCCGTGTIAELLTQSGYTVTGFDLSQAMIDEAQQKAIAKKLEIAYHQADVCTLQLNQTFEGAYSFFDSLNYITTTDGLCAAIKSVAHHLEPGATFIFDVNTEYAFTQRLFDQGDQRKKALIKYDWRGDYNPESRIIQVTMNFDRQGEQFQEVHIQRAHSDEEIRQALADAGFSHAFAYDSYTLDRPNKRSDRTHYVAILGV
jgi:ubiquinone/menaquinone biosynthesis C-methylase UbiE